MQYCSSSMPNAWNTDVLSAAEIWSKLKTNNTMYVSNLLLCTQHRPTSRNKDACQTTAAEMNVDSAYQTTCTHAHVLTSTYLTRLTDLALILTSLHVTWSIHSVCLEHNGDTSSFGSVGLIGAKSLVLFPVHENSQVIFCCYITLQNTQS